jgi:diguanylate cyclase (GGDEF)-like protein
MALLFMDLDRFKEVNDSLGHRVGNELLAQLGQRLQDHLSKHHTVARLGGDEFAVLLEHIPNPTVAIAMAEQLRNAIIQPFYLQQYEVYIDASIGIALGSEQYQQAEDWLRDADAAMYQIKDLPDRHWHIFDSSLQNQRHQRLQSEMALRQALDRQELRLYYQPIVTLSTQAIIGFEALVRWQHPERGLLMPGEFIATAEATGLIIPLGWWVLEEACQQMQTWSELHPTMANLSISVNMSSKQFSQQNLVEKVQDILAKTRFSPHRLKLEITEGVLIHHSESIVAILEQLRAMGIGLAVDDFGTGYSSLSYLHRFPFDCLKIDRSFIENADQDFEKLEILQSVVRLAWNLGLDVVAEGVETQRHYAQLKALRCESGQGYLFSQPLPPEGIEALVADHLTVQVM